MKINLSNCSLGGFPSFKILFFKINTSGPTLMIMTKDD